MDMFYLKDILADEIRALHDRHHTRREEQERERKRAAAMEMQHDSQCAFGRGQLGAITAASVAAAASFAACSVSPGPSASLVDFLASLSASPATELRPEPTLLPDTPPFSAPHAATTDRNRRATGGDGHNDQLKASKSRSSVEPSVPAVPVTVAPHSALPVSSFPARSLTRSTFETPFSCATFAQLHAAHSSSLSPVLSGCFDEEAEEKEHDSDSDNGDKTLGSSAQQLLSPFAAFSSPARGHSQRTPQPALQVLTFPSTGAVVSAGDMDSKHNTPPPALLKDLAQFEDAVATTQQDPTQLAPSLASPKQLALWELDDAVEIARMAAAAAATAGATASATTASDPAAAPVDSPSKGSSTDLVASNATISAVSTWTADLSAEWVSPLRSRWSLRSSLLFCCFLLLLSVSLVAVVALLDEYALTLRFGGVIDVTLPSLLIDAFGIDQWPGVQHALFVPRASSFCS